MSGEGGGGQDFGEENALYLPQMKTFDALCWVLSSTTNY